MYTLLISGLVIFTSAHVASVALTNYVVGTKPAIEAEVGSKNLIFDEKGQLIK